MSKPLYRVNPERQIAGIAKRTNTLERRPLTNEWQNPAAFLPIGGIEGVDEIDLLAIAGNGWTQGSITCYFRWHMDNAFEMKGRLSVGPSGTVAFTLPGFDEDNEVDYRAEGSFTMDLETSPTTFTLGRVIFDPDSGDVTIVYPAT